MSLSSTSVTSLLRRASTATRRMRPLAALALAGLLLGSLAFVVPAEARQVPPTPSIYPIAWEVDLNYRHPRRIVVEEPGQLPRAYWYMIYTVTNNSDQELFFIPDIQLLTRDGELLPANRNFSRAVFDAIQRRHRAMILSLPQDMVARLRIGEDEARTSVAIWEEPRPDMGTFSIFFGGLSGEVVTLTDHEGRLITNEDGQPIRIRKTRQLIYRLRADDRPRPDPRPELIEDRWIMR